MDHIGAILAGLVLLTLQVLTYYFLIIKIKAMITCSKTINAKVGSVTEETKRYRDSKTDKVEYRYYYTVKFYYDYNGQTYETTRSYSDRCKYSTGYNATIKINPNNPKETWMSDEIKDLLAFVLSIPLYAFFDLLYIGIVF